MATNVMTPVESPRSSRLSSGDDRSIHELITAAREVPVRVPSRSAWGLSALAALLLWASFTPLDWGPLGWIALTPMVLLIRTPVRARWLYTATYLAGFGQMVASLQWMRLGDASMYTAWIALAAYMAVYVPVFVALSRVAVHRWNVPLTLAVPVVWTGLEFLRAHIMTGFSWYFLAHTQYRWIELIQISDVLGAYGVTFVVAMMSACLAAVLPLGWLARLRLFVTGTDPLAVQAGEPSDVRTPRRQVVTVSVCLGLLLTALVYGYVRRGQAEFREGPKVALIQADFTTSLKLNPNSRYEIYNKHHELTGKAVYPHNPDLIVWPETMYRSPLMMADPSFTEDELLRRAPMIPPEAWKQNGVPAALASEARMAGAAMFIGLDTFDIRSDGLRHFNSAAFIRPDTGLVGRYDKMHLVPFGEYLPLQKELPLLQVLSPIPSEASLSKGEYAHAFAWKDWRFAPIICFEDTVPHVVRGIVKATQATSEGNDAEAGPSRKVDCLVNLTNDGWFHGSSELDQHLITAAFRSVECRTPMVRAVNTGISAFIDGDGVIREPEVFLDGDGQDRGFYNARTGRWNKNLNAVLISSVPLDDRSSLYVAWGDWFAGTCGFGCIAIALGSFTRRKP